MPLIQEYVDSGEFTAIAKMKQSIRFNCIFIAVISVVGIIFVAYLVATGEITR